VESPDIGRVRKMTVYLMRALTGLTGSEIGEVFNMKFSAVSKAVLSIEKEMEKGRGLKKEIGRLISNFEASPLNPDDHSD